jgi:DNA-directed RNA polymerase specialized sigma24 family protein
MTMTKNGATWPGYGKGAVMARDRTDTRKVIDLDIERSADSVYDAEFGRLAGWTTKLVGDPDLAHDLATEAFVKMLRNWSTVREPCAWLYVTAANLVRDHWRKRGHEATAYERHTAGVPSTWALPREISPPP